MNQLPFKTEQGNFLIVEVPERADAWINPSVSNFIHIGDINGEAYSHILPHGNWQIIGNLWELTEEQAKGVVAHNFFFSQVFQRNVKNYKDYSDHEYRMIGSADSLKSLIKSLNVHKENPYDNYECQNQWCEHGYIDMGYNEKMRCQFCQDNEDNQDEAQKTTFTNAVLLKQI